MGETKGAQPRPGRRARRVVASLLPGLCWLSCMQLEVRGRPPGPFRAAAGGPAAREPTPATTLVEALARGREAAARGEREAAETSYEQAVALAPHDAGARFGLAEALLWRGVVAADAAALERAANILAELERTCPDSPGVGNLARLVALERQRP